MLSLNLNQKKGLVLGVANERSIAWHIAKTLKQAGAEVAITYLDQRALRKVQVLIDEIASPIAIPCDVTDDAQLESLFQRIEREWGDLDFIVHSLAYAEISDLKQEIYNCSKEGYLKAIKSFLLVSIA